MIGYLGAIRIVLVDDREMIADGLTALLQSEPGLEVVFHAPSLNLAMIGADRPPHVLIVQAELRDGDAFAAMRTARLAWPRIRVILLVRDLLDSLLDRAVRARVDGMVIDREPTASLVDAIREVAAGRRAYSPTAAARLRIRGNGHADGPTHPPGAKLTAREFDVLNHLAAGHSVRQTAETLGVTRNTIDNHKTRLMRKVGVHSTVALTRYAIREGLITP